MARIPLRLATYEMAKGKKNKAEILKHSLEEQLKDPNLAAAQRPALKKQFDEAKQELDEATTALAEASKDYEDKNHKASKFNDRYLYSGNARRAALVGFGLGAGAAGGLVGGIMAGAPDQESPAPTKPVDAPPVVDSSPLAPDDDDDDDDDTGGGGWYDDLQNFFAGDDGEVDPIKVMWAVIAVVLILAALATLARRRGSR